MRPGCGVSTTPARPQHSGDATPRERELLFRLSYLRLYEDESRSGGARLRVG